MISCSLCSSVLSYNCLDFYNNLLDLYPSLMSPFPADPITCYSLWSIALLISLCYLLHLVSCKIVQNFWVRCVPNFWVAFLVLLYSSCSILIFFYHPFLPLMLTLNQPPVRIAKSMLQMRFPSPEIHYFMYNVNYNKYYYLKRLPGMCTGGKFFLFCTNTFNTLSELQRALSVSCLFIFCTSPLHTRQLSPSQHILMLIISLLTYVYHWLLLRQKYSMLVMEPLLSWIYKMCHIALKSNLE